MASKSSIPQKALDSSASSNWTSHSLSNSSLIYTLA
jgi:hypothetical protein